MQSHRKFFGILVVVLAAVVFTAGCTTAPAPVMTISTPTSSPPIISSPSSQNFTGVWTGTTIGHTRADGFRETDTAQYTFTAQKEMAFTGYKDYIRANGTRFRENVSGVLSRDGQISIAGEFNDIMLGTFIGPDEMELILLQPGVDAKALIVHLTRSAS